MTAFISGHCNLSNIEFDQYYKLKIDQALEQGHSFVVGESPGADTLAIQYLSGKTDKVTIYHIGTNSRVASNFKTIGGFRNHSQKDSAMTYASTYDILYVRPEEEQRRLVGPKYIPGYICGTEQNRRRREKV